MKNILIPTTLQTDTIAAIHSAIRQADNHDCEIILLFASEAPNTYSSSQFLREMKIGHTADQEEILDNCRTIINQTPNCKIKIHNQCGLSSFIFKGIIDLYTVDLIVFPNSYKQETRKINQYLLQLATNQKCPILHLGQEQKDLNFSKALYVKNNQAKIGLETIQHFLNKYFPLEIVSQTTTANEDQDDVLRYINEAISKHDIDMLVQTRSTQKIKFKKTKKEDLHEKVGLPVLSLYEELV
jgi:hypothetical protein